MYFCFTSSMSSFYFLLFVFQYTMAITVPGLVRPQTVEDFSTVLTSIYNNDDDTSAAAAATPGTELIAFTGDIAESSGGKPGSLPLVADADCNSQASEFLDSIPSSTSIFRRRSSSGSRFARRQNKNENFCPQPIVPNPPKTQQQQSRPGRMPAAVLESPRLSDLLIQATRDQGPCRNFKRRYEVAVCAPPSVPPRPSFADLLIPCRLCKFYFSLLDSHQCLFPFV